MFYGKYLWTKGIHILLQAAPLILEKNPDTYFIIVGYGASRGYLEMLLAALINKNIYKELEEDINVHYFKDLKLSGDFVFKVSNEELIIF